MIRACDLELMVVHLEAALAYAKVNGFDVDFLIHLEQLINTVKENQ